MAYKTKSPYLRQEVIDAILYARDPETVNRAEQLLDEWLAMEPDDEGMRIYAAGLQRMKDALQLVAAGKGDETDPAKRVL